MPNSHSPSLGVFGWVQRMVLRRLQRTEGPRRHPRPGNAARSLEVFRTMPFSPLDRETEFHSSASSEERISNRFDNEVGIENDEASGFTSRSPGVYELDASDNEDGREEEESDPVDQPETASSGVYELAASDMHELSMTGTPLRIATELDIEDGVIETWSPVSEMSVNAGTDPFQLLMPNAIRFLLSLDFVILEEMEEDARQCSICTDDYVIGEEHEAPVNLDCGHVFGNVCLDKWLCPYDFDPKRSCPMCRAVLFEEDQYPVHHETENSRELPAVLEEPISEENIDEDEEGSEAIDLLDTIASANRVVDIYDRVRAMGPLQAVDSALAERVPARQHPLSSSADILFSFRHLIGPSDMSALETRETALAIRMQMGRLFVRLQDAMRERQMPMVWKEDGPPLSFLLDPAAQPLLESALERMIEIEEAWDWSET